MTIQEKHVSTRSVAVSHQWITHTLRSICVCTLSTVITYVVKFIIVLGMACHSRRWGHCRCSLQSVGVNVSVRTGNIWDIRDWMRIYSHAETPRTPTKVLFGPTRISFQAAVGLAGGSWQQWGCNTGSNAGETKSAARVYMTLPMERWSV